MGHFRIHALALGGIQFAACGNQQLVKLGVDETGVVPFCGRKIGGGVHLVLHRTATPIRGAERGNVPNVRPVAIIRLNLDAQRNARSIGRGREEVGRIDCTRESTRSNLQHDGRAVMAGLLVEVCRRRRIIVALRDGLIKHRVGGVDREVVAARAKAAQHLVHQLLTVDRHLQRHPQVIVVKGRLVAMHDEDIVAGARGALDHDFRRGFQQLHDLGINAVDHVNLTRLDRRGAGGVVIDGQNLDAIRMTARAVPIVRVALERGDDARLIRGDLIGTRANASGRIVHTTAGLDDQVIVTNQERQVGIGRGQLQRDHVAFGRHLGNALHNAQGARLGFLIGVALQRGHHVFSGQGAATVEFNALTDLELPLGRIGVGRHFLGQTHVKRTRRVHRNQSFAPSVQDHVGVRRGRQCGVQRVGAFAPRHAHSQHAALLGLISMGSLGEQSPCQTGRNTHRRGTTDEFAAGHGAFADTCNHLVKLIGHRSLPAAAQICRGLVFA